MIVINYNNELKINIYNDNDHDDNDHNDEDNSDNDENKIMKKNISLV